MRKEKIDFCIIIILILTSLCITEIFIHVRYVRKVKNVIQTNEYEEIKKNYRISESERINQNLYENTIVGYDFIDSKYQSIPCCDSAQFNGKILFIFKFSNCQSCIDNMFKLYTQFNNIPQKEKIVFIGGEENPKTFFAFLSNRDINLDNGFYSNSFVEAFIGHEDIPIVLVISDNKVSRACFIDKDLPIEFYKELLKSVP